MSWSDFLRTDRSDFLSLISANCFMKTKLLLFCLIVSFVSYSQSKDENAIRQLLAQQTESWNKGDIEGFMQTYWKSDSLMFIGNLRG